jgi:hypothetical protein
MLPLLLVVLPLLGAPLSCTAGAGAAAAAWVADSGRLPGWLLLLLPWYASVAALCCCHCWFRRGLLNGPSVAAAAAAAWLCVVCAAEV